MRLPTISLESDSDGEVMQSPSRRPKSKTSEPVRRRREIVLAEDCGTSSPQSPRRSQSLRRPSKSSASPPPPTPMSGLCDMGPLFRTASLRVKQQLTARLSEPLRLAENLNRSMNKLLATGDDQDDHFQHYSVLHAASSTSLQKNAEDAGSSSEDDDPEYLELMERDNIITRYEKGPDSQDVDPWENPQFDVYAKTDRFGFIHKSSDKASEEERKHQRRVFKELSREKKWLKMIEDWKSGKPSKKMEDRVWKGIPEKLRLVVWPRLLGAERMREEKKDVYMNLLLRARLVSKDIKQIDLDINRTYRDHLAFRKRYDVKQKSLLNVLAAYSMYNTEVGYCQGMSQIVALFLMYLDEEDAFWCLHALMVSPRHTMHGFFVPGFPKLSRYEEHFKKVLKKYRPRVYKHLEKQDIPSVFPGLEIMGRFPHRRRSDTHRDGPQYHEKCMKDQ
ncbi:unnamed protein product [Caenorhabditis auriculariae]|uniref:Rab-GAP TBC domain-containing protein n=1 Tax=Caenorhabditis auriculariae TaxID=2777116 RepID=A0A8S1H4N1_9PELO|nr:unnamed protein product [Caenorhabditis auriculariae]